jgi:hypothetical protein
MLAPARLAFKPGVAEIACRYAAADHPDDIADWPARSGITPNPPSILSAIVLPVCELYRSNELPIQRWWRPDELSRTLLGYYARRRLSAADIRHVMAELVERWKLLDPEVGADLLAEAMAPPPESPDIFTATPSNPAQRWLQKVAKLAEIRREVDAALAGYSPVLLERTDLTGFVRCAGRRFALAVRRGGAAGLRPVRRADRLPVRVRVGRQHRGTGERRPLRRPRRGVPGVGSSCRRLHAVAGRGRRRLPVLGGVLPRSCGRGAYRPSP